MSLPLSVRLCKSSNLEKQKCFYFVNTIRHITGTTAPCETWLSCDGLSYDGTAPLVPHRGQMYHILAALSPWKVPPGPQYRSQYGGERNISKGQASNHLACN
jgi:hypothetical protein